MGLLHSLLSIPQQLSGSFFSAVPELMSFPPLADSLGFAASEICHEKLGVGWSQARGRGRREAEAASRRESACLGPGLFTLSSLLSKAGSLGQLSPQASRGHAYSKTVTFQSPLFPTLVWMMPLQDAFPLGS